MGPTVDMNHPIYSEAFQKVFTSLQLSSAYVLYYDLDWSKDDVIEYQGLLTKTDEQQKNGKLPLAQIIDTLRTEISFDCFKENDRMPYRTKIKMCQIKYKQKQVFTVGIASDNAAGEHLALAVYTLWKYYKFDKEKINTWYTHLIDFCKLYTTGMTDKHVLKYFAQECELYIKKD